MKKALIAASLAILSALPASADLTPVIQKDMPTDTEWHDLQVNEVNRLKQQKLDLKISEDDYRKQLSEIKSGKDTPTVIIKATDKSSYKNLIDALDEMQICNIGKYVITDIAEADEFLMKNYESKGELSQNIAE